MRAGMKMTAALSGGEGVLGQVASDEPALEPSGPGVGGGDEPALGLGGMSKASEEHEGGVFVDLTGFVDEDGAVLLRAESAPVGEVSEVDGRGEAVGPVVEPELDELGGGLLSALDEFGRAGEEELLHGGGGEVGEMVSGDEDVVAGVSEGGVDGEFDDGSGLPPPMAPP